KKLINKAFLFTLILPLTIILSGCVTGKQLPDKLSPLDIIPGDFSVYLKIKKIAATIPVINEKIEEFSSQRGVPKFLKERTDNISALFLDDNWGYIVTQGSYPDSFIRDRLEESEEWKEGAYRKLRYYFSDNTKTIIILFKNTIIVSDFKKGKGQESDSADFRAKRIIDIIISNESVTYPVVDNSVFHITSKTPDNVFTQFVNENVNLDTIKEVNFDVILDPKNKKAGGINISFLVEDEKKALLFNSVIRLFISDYVVKKKITDVKTLRENNSIYHDEVFVYVNIPDIPLEKLNTFIADFIIDSP
ncbi:MAG: hypothetical protein FWF38_04550, partial [Spirochaetaceae bacterium]|nr:hypothetical protein [Spirochaetaceae bacterium]